MKAPTYVPESDDLIASRAKDAAEYREFLREWAAEKLRLGYSRDVFNHLWDVKEAA